MYKKNKHCTKRQETCSHMLALVLFLYLRRTKIITHHDQGENTYCFIKVIFHLVFVFCIMYITKTRDMMNIKNNNKNNNNNKGTNDKREREGGFLLYCLCVRMRVYPKIA